MTATIVHASSDFLSGAPLDEKLGSRSYGPAAGVALALIFVAPFFDWRRPVRLLHFDLLALLAFGVSHRFFNRAELDVSAPLAYAVLAYLLVRALVAGFRPRHGDGPLLPWVPATWLVIGIAVLLAGRVAINVADSPVSDVGYASVIGADRVAHGDELYDGNFPGLAHEGEDPDVEAARHPGDVYGPITYVAYVPFEQIFPWSGQWDDVPAAHAATLTFDLLTALGLFLLGLTFRSPPQGRVLGLALAFAWMAYPYTTFAMFINTNDQLLAMLLVYAFLALRSPPGRGALLGIGTAAKFVPAVLAPLFASGLEGRSWRGWLGFGAVFVAVVAALAVIFLPPGGFDQLYDRTLGYQSERAETNYTLWHQAPSLDWLQTVARVGAIGLGALVAFAPRRKSPAQVAALGAAVIIALELGLNHWLYVYIIWFAPYLLFAFFSPYASPDPRARYSGGDVGGERRAGAARV